MTDTYTQVLKSYEENPKVQILRKIRGAKALKALSSVMGVAEPTEWFAGWTAAEKGGVRGFLYTRRLRTNAKTGVKLISKRGGEDSVLGHEVSEAKAEALLHAFA